MDHRLIFLDIDGTLLPPGDMPVSYTHLADAPVLEAAMHSLTAPVRDAEEKYVQLLCALVRRGSGAVQLTGRVRFCARCV